MAVCIRLLMLYREAPISATAMILVLAVVVVVLVRR